MTQIRIATWNLERCPSGRKALAEAQQRRIAEVDADVWVLTETFTDRTPGAEFTGVHCPQHPGRRSDPTERYTGIWSRWPIQSMTDPAAHRRGTVAAFVETPIGAIVVYGTVIAYGNERQHDDGAPAEMWEVHLTEIERQAAEWRRIRTLYPNTPLIVAGDFNQARSGRKGSYGTTRTRQALTDALNNTGLTCHSEGDFVADGTLKRSHVERICTSGALTPAGHLRVWDRSDETGRHLSDHPTLALDLTIAG